MSQVTISSDTLKLLFCGPSKLPCYYKKIISGHKRKESIIHFISICLGFIIGLILSLTALVSVSNAIAKMLNFEEIAQIIVDIVFTLTCSVILSSIVYGLSKLTIDLYNLKMFGVANSQFKPLNNEEIKKIIEGSSTELNLNEQNVKNIHEAICTLIKAQIYKAERQQLKSAHWQFRRGNISNACNIHPLFSSAVANNMIESDLSLSYIRRHTSLGILTNNVQNGNVLSNSVEERVHNITVTVEKLLVELLILKDILDMGSTGRTNGQIILTSDITNVCRNNSYNNNLQMLNNESNV